MNPEEVRRIDVGDGIYVRVPGAGSQGASSLSGDAPSRSRKVPPVALALGVGLAGAALIRLGLTADGVLAAGLLVVLAALGGIDVRARMLPNRIIGPAMLAVFAWQLAFAPAGVPESLLAAVGAGAFLLLPGLLQPGAVGMGDVKLAALLGLALGAQVVAALMIGFLAVMPAALAMLILGGSGARRSAIPFGPFLGLGAAVVLLVP
jgi:leader peptidase (prepilin peptidase)/N-methyltransferase